MLKSLELVGFKSFADRTRFDFDPGITGVVGPNGSGKSNVVDSIKWILGDQSAKSLRGSEMADVIFNGSAGRKPGQLAEATLTFDNASGFLPVEHAEVSIGRRLWRSGDSEYLINGAAARLKDIRELFMGTGAGSAAYCIIEQGRVDQILQANAVSRRAIFEEAAGVSRFKHRRIEAQRRLERVDQNLLRLSDIVDELETRLNSLRSQAEKAARYRELSAELKEAWLGLAADDQRFLTAQLTELDERCARSDAELQTLNARRSELDAAASDLDRLLGELDDRLRAVERERSTAREEVARQEANVRHHAARRRELESELGRLRRTRRRSDERLREADAERARLQSQLERFDREFHERMQQLEQRSEGIDGSTRAISREKQRLRELRTALGERTRDVAAAAARTHELRTRLEGIQEDRKSLVERDANLTQSIGDARKACERTSAALEELRTELAELSQAAESLRARRDEFQHAADEEHSRLLKLREERTAAAARQSVLEDLDRRQEGVGIGVREILQRARTSRYPPWDAIHGCAADLLDVDLERAALLEVALGSRAELIVIDDFEPLIEYLASGAGCISGRVGFVALAAREDGSFAHFRLDQSALPDLADLPGIEGRADEFVAGSSVAGLAERLLADTWIVDRLETAAEISAGAGRGCRFVTLQGERLEPDGTLTVGTVRSEAALVSRRSELRSLKNELARLDHKVGEGERRCARSQEELAAVERELHETDRRVQSATTQRLRLQTEDDTARQQLARLLAEECELKDEAGGRERDEGQVREDLEQAELASARAAEELAQVEEEIAAAEREVARLEHRLGTHREQRADEQLELTRHEERLAGLREALTRLDEDRRQKVQERDEAARRCEAVAAKLVEIDLAVLNATAELAELSLAGEGIAEQVEELSAEKSTLRGRRSRLVEEDAGLRRRLHAVGDARHAAEIEARDIRHRLATLAERIAEEYQLSMDEVVAGGASAYRAWLEARGDDGESDLDCDRLDGGDPAAPAFQEIRGELERQVERLRRKLKTMGAVDTESLHDLEELEDRYRRFSVQLKDFEEARAALETIIRRINEESRRRFQETFVAVREHFQELFRKLFGGGNGDIVLEDPEDPLECGIDIVARPPGKELKSISLLSGGEKTLTAIAMLLALFRSRPSPYCLLDEVDAALDEANVGRLLMLLEEFKQTTQFIVITHKKPTMTICDVLYGVTMEQSGVSKRMSVRFDDVSETGEFRAAA